MKPESLQRCQVATPHEVIEFMWHIAHQKHKKFAAVADFGAGDARFARFGAYDRYVGYEIDERRFSAQRLPANATLVCKDAFLTIPAQFDLCIGNPPYVKSSELDTRWRESVCAELERQLARPIARNANLFTYFMFLSLLRTTGDGLVVQLVPYEWVTRPSTRALRALIMERGWSVDVYRFRDDVFDRVLTTASVSVIDKSTKKSVWRYFELSKDFAASALPGPSGTRSRVLEYADRPLAGYCLRGLSPGGQELFVLTEHERVFYRLRADSDVYPCVTTLRGVPPSVEKLTKREFSDFFVARGNRCWLLKSDVDKPSIRVMDYLNTVAKESWSKYTTCTSRKPWWQYKSHPPPPILLSSGFRDRRPKVLANAIGAIACGSVYAVFVKNKSRVPSLTRRLRNFEYGSRVVGHSNGLKKLEVKQVNAVIQRIMSD
jgi:hypothetical protein